MSATVRSNRVACARGNRTTTGRCITHTSARRTDELRSAKVERQAVVVVETPDAVRTSWLEHVQLLQASHEREVRGKEAEHERWEVRLREEADLVETACVCMHEWQ